MDKRERDWLSGKTSIIQRAKMPSSGRTHASGGYGDLIYGTPEVVGFGRGNTRVIWSTYLASMLAYASGLTALVWGLIILSWYFKGYEQWFWLTVAIFVAFCTVFAMAVVYRRTEE